MPRTRRVFLRRIRKQVLSKHDLEWGTRFLKNVAKKHDTIVESTFSDFMHGISWENLEEEEENDIRRGIADLYQMIKVCMKYLKEGMDFVSDEVLISEITSIQEEHDPNWVSKEMLKNIQDVAILDFENLGDYVMNVLTEILDNSDSTEFVEMCDFWNRAVSLLKRIELEFKHQVNIKRKMALVMSLHKRLGEKARICVLGEDLVKLLCNYVK